MRHVVLAFLAISLSTLLGAPGFEVHSADGRCTTHDRIQLGTAGYTKAEIGDMCGPHSTDIPPTNQWSILAGEGQPRWTQRCVTPQGSCFLNPATVGYYPIGAPCNCYMPWGSYGGVAQ